MKRLLILDNRDSFSYNLRHLFLKIDDVEVIVVPTAESATIDFEDIDGLILSPGPGLPDDHPGLAWSIAQAENRMPILGVCLGLQAIGEYYGGQLHRLETVRHGKISQVHITEKTGLWVDCESPFTVGRYHSYVLNAQNLPASLNVTSQDNNDEIMGIRHASLPIYGVQFHPESYMTTNGIQIAQNFVDIIE